MNCPKKILDKGNQLSINQTADWEVFSDVLGESGFFSAIKLTMVNKGRKFPYSSPKRKTLQAESKKRLILKVATEVFAEKGFNETTVSQIAQKAKISEGSIYHYFASKEDLLFSIPEERMENFLSGLHESLEGIKGALNKIRKLIWYHLQFYQKNRDYVLILLQNIRQNPRFNSTRAYSLIRNFGKLVAQIIEEGKEEGAIRRDVDSRILRDAILGAIEHTTIRGSILGRLPKLTDVAPLIYDFFVSGIQTQAGMVTIPLQEFLQLKKSGMVGDDLKPARN
jgi:TetR/AcrR family fatty acid metabolism transcriptional regulator